MPIEIDQITTRPEEASARSLQIKINEDDRGLVSDASWDGQGERVALIVGAAVAVSGVAWILIGASISPLGLMWVGGPNGHRFLVTNEVSSNSPERSPNSLSPVRDFRKGDRLQIRDSAGEIRQMVREVTSEALDTAKLSSLASDRADGPKSALAAAPPAQPSRNKASSVAQQHTSARGPQAGDVHATAKPAPTPETRPTTVKGWTLREVVDGTAVLQGPDRTWKVTRGDTVPGLGTVQSIVRWGSRWIVATSGGLVSTP